MEQITTNNKIPKNGFLKKVRFSLGIYIAIIAILASFAGGVLLGKSQAQTAVAGVGNGPRMNADEQG